MADTTGNIDAAIDLLESIAVGATPLRMAQYGFRATGLRNPAQIELANSWNRTRQVFSRIELATDVGIAVLSQTLFVLRYVLSVVYAVPTPRDLPQVEAMVAEDAAVLHNAFKIPSAWAAGEYIDALHLLDHEVERVPSETGDGIVGLILNKPMEAHVWA